LARTPEEASSTAGYPAAGEAGDDGIGDPVRQRFLGAGHGGLEQHSGHRGVAGHAAPLGLFPELPNQIRVNPQRQRDELLRPAGNPKDDISPCELLPDLIPRLDRRGANLLVRVRSLRAFRGNPRSQASD